MKSEYFKKIKSGDYVISGQLYGKSYDLIEFRLKKIDEDFIDLISIYACRANIFDLLNKELMQQVRRLFDNVSEILLDGEYQDLRVYFIEQKLDRFKELKLLIDQKIDPVLFAEQEQKIKDKLAELIKDNGSEDNTEPDQEDS